MKNKWKEIQERRARLKRRIRKKIRGTFECPRLVVFRGLRNAEVQLVDDTIHKTLFSVNSRTIDVGSLKNTRNRKVAVGKLLGKVVAEKARERNIKKVVFDRGGYLYHGRIKAIAEGAREGGLEF